MEDVAARRASGDALVTRDGWCASYTTTGASKLATLNLFRRATVTDSFGAMTFEVVEDDPMHGSVFETTDHAQLYALNAGRLQWFRDWKAAHGIGGAR
jgi:hypothetical protein